MNWGFEVDTSEVRRLASNLRRGGSQLDAAAAAGIPTPDAGQSSGEVAAALTRLTDRTRDMVQTLDRVARDVAESADAYDETDTQVQARLHRLDRAGAA